MDGSFGVYMLKDVKKKPVRKWRRELQNALRIERQLVARVLSQLLSLQEAEMGAKMLRKIRGTNLFSKILCPS